MRFLIDGYNLLHAVGWLTPKVPRQQLEGARLRLLDWLADAPATKAPDVRHLVVFDALKGRAPSVGQSHRGILVHYAYRRTADDLIEELLQAEPTPRLVTVVSNDQRLMESARRQGSRGWGCTAFIDWLIIPPTTPGEEPGSPEKPPGPSEAEIEEWLSVFQTPKRR